MTSTITTHPVETVGGITTSWLPMTSAYPSIAGCESQFWGVVPGIKAVWDPGYGLYVQKEPQCHPKEVTSWWDAEHLNVNVKQTQFSIGPVTCPEAYTTAKTSVNAQGSTKVACCPKSYTFADWFPAGDTGECISQIDSGQVLTYVTYVSSVWTKTTTTFTASSVMNGIPVNGWLFPTTTSTSTSISDNSTSSSSSAAPASSSSKMSTGAYIGIGLGVALGVIGLVALLTAICLLRRRRNRASIPPPGYNITYEKVAPLELGPRDEVSSHYATAKAPVVEMEGGWSPPQDAVELPTPPMENRPLDKGSSTGHSTTS